MRVLPNTWVRPVALLVALTELTVPPLLAIPSVPVTAAGYAVASGLLLALTAAIGLALQRGSRAPCRCFSAGTTPLGAVHLIRNGLLGVVAVTGLIGVLRHGGTMRLEGIVVAAAAGLVLAVLAMVFDEIVALFAIL